MSENIVASVNGVTEASGVLTRDETYSVSLKLGRIQSSIVKLQKKTVSGWEDISERDDLIQIKDVPLFLDELRIIVEDNTGWDLIHRRSLLYMRRNLSEILNFSIPLKLEVRRFHRDQQLAVKGNDDIRAVITVTDPKENTNQIKGVFSTSPKNSGKDFITLFNNEIHSPSQHDNCAQDLAPKILEGRCRIARVRADHILFYSNSNNRLSKYSEDTVFSNIVFVDRWREERDSNNIEFITANIDFRPPPILGDNYTFKISIEKGPNYILSIPFIKYKNGKDCYETPKITIWRKVRLKLFVQGSNPSDRSIYDQIEWNEIKRAYNDAYIEVEYPTTPHPVGSSHGHPHSQQQSQTYFYIIPTDQWIRYLDRYVYSGWRRNAWINLRNGNPSKLQQDLKDFSFPQDSLAPSDDLSPTSWDLLGRLAYEIARDVMQREEGRNARVRNAVSTQDCFYVLACRTPRPNSRVGGRFEGGKLFYIVAKIGGDAAGFLTHEMGHALFLNHGATRFVEIWDFSLANNYPVIVRSRKSGEEGPYWDLHDSEDMISCVMSYENDYHGAGNSVNWHFCGVCLLLLRFYDEIKLGRSNIFRSIQYTLRNGGNMRIAHADEARFNSTTEIVNISLNSSLRMRRRERRILLVLYPREGVINNLGYNYYKDVSTHPRRQWRFLDPNTNQEVPINRRIANISIVRFPGDILLTRIRAVRKGRNTISFGIRGSGNSFTWSDPLTVEVA